METAYLSLRRHRRYQIYIFKVHCCSYRYNITIINVSIALNDHPVFIRLHYSAVVYSRHRHTVDTRIAIVTVAALAPAAEDAQAEDSQTDRLGRKRVRPRPMTIPPLACTHRKSKYIKYYSELYLRGVNTQRGSGILLLNVRV